MISPADLGVFTNGQDASRGDLPFDFAVDDEFVLKFDRSLDLHVSGKKVFASDWFSHEIWFGYI
ncbi:MAG: hypothetical protein WDN28_18570 [Chthoniobacter sp.]